ncbi:MAG: metal-dependent transcriptional regulator [bacterium]|nr:metal-dependent transcriptional regulator [bacterium]
MKHYYDEALEEIWMLLEREENTIDRVQACLERTGGAASLQDLLAAKYITLDKEKVRFTGLGEEHARNIIRRHRLAERLLADVLGMTEVEGQACKMEHILSEEATDRICTLLGHPQECPHGLSIPAGSCCRQPKETLDSLIITVDRLRIGEEARIAYIQTGSDERLHKLVSFGLHPGAVIRLHQRFPAVVIRTEETQLALEEEIAREIHVRRKAEA